MEARAARAEVRILGTAVHYGSPPRKCSPISFLITYLKHLKSSEIAARWATGAYMWYLRLLALRFLSCIGSLQVRLVTRVTVEGVEAVEARVDRLANDRWFKALKLEWPKLGFWQLTNPPNNLQLFYGLASFLLYLLFIYPKTILRVIPWRKFMFSIV